MVNTTQISAHINIETKTRLDRYVQGRRVTRAQVIEQALLHHLQALDELPAEVVVPVRMVLSEASAKRVRDLVTRPPEPTPAMKQLFLDR